MSGIYIPGVEMPPNCSECAFCGYYGNGEHMCDIIEKAVEYESGKTSRRDDCPLVPVPEHGPLVDALDVINTFPEEFIFTNEQARALTNYIIPADPAKEGEG